MTSSGSGSRKVFQKLLQQKQLRIHIHASAKAREAAACTHANVSVCMCAREKILPENFFKNHYFMCREEKTCMLSNPDESALVLKHRRPQARGAPQSRLPQAT